MPFWSLTRLFGCYKRVISVLPLPFEQRYFLAADIENFVIRMHVVLNDIAYVVRQLLPKNVRGLKGPGGGTHPKNQEMSIIDMIDFLIESADQFPELSAAFAKASDWISILRDRRNNVLLTNRRLSCLNRIRSPSHL